MMRGLLKGAPFLRTIFEGFVNHFDASFLPTYEYFLKIFNAESFHYVHNKVSKPFWNNEILNIKIYPNKGIIMLDDNVWRFKIKDGELKLYKGISCVWWCTEKAWHNPVVQAIGDYIFEKAILI